MILFCITIGLIYFSQVFRDVDSDNLLFTKVDYCGEEISDNLNDGDKLIVLSMTTICKTTSEIMVTLDGHYYVNYVVFYGVEENKKNQLAFFNVQLSNETMNEICGRYPGRTKSNNTGLIMRLNCKPKTLKATNVRFIFLTNVGLHLAEIEVHSIGALHLNIPLIYHGCFSKVEATHKQEINWTRCMEKCREMNFMLVGMKGDICTCVENEYEIEEIPGRSCNKKCSDGVRNCGGEDGYSVYFTFVPLPYPRACEYFPSELPFHSNMTVEMCLKRCDEYEFAVLRAPENCKCFDAVDVGEKFMGAVWSEGQIRPRCLQPCKNDPDNYCAADEYVIVYSTCKYKDNIDQEETLECSNLFHCNGTYDMHGVCKNGCEEGYIGEHCLERVTEMCDFDPCDLDTSSCLQINDTYECVCHKGFEMFDGTCIAEKHALVNPLMYFGLILCLVLFLVTIYLFRKKFRS